MQKGPVCLSEVEDCSSRGYRKNGGRCKDSWRLPFPGVSKYNIAWSQGDYEEVGRGWHGGGRIDVLTEGTL
jgi:hypothetical protein